MAKAKVTANRTQLTLRTYTRFSQRQLPLIFQESHCNIYPDTRDDILGGPVKKVKYDAIVLENPHIRVTIVPDLGGKIWSVYDKHARRETLHVPDCVKPALVMLRGAWIAGGMEFNFPVGHHIDSMAPLQARLIEEGPDRAVAVVERTCRRSGLHMEVRTILRADEACFDLAMTLSNPTSLSRRWYEWTNVGVTASDDWRFCSKGNLYTNDTNVENYPVDHTGRDISWYRNRYIAGDNFMVGLREDCFGCYDYSREHGLAHWAPWQEIRGKKYFTWGSRDRAYDSGRNLCDTGDDYLEIQTGPMETQSHFAIMQPRQKVAFTGTWMPYRQTGGIEWACRSLIFNVRDGVPWVYATTAVEAGIVINGRKHRVQLKAGDVTRLRAKVKNGDRIEISVDGRKQRDFTYPLQGRMEPGARQRAEHEYKITQLAWKGAVPNTPGQALAVAREMVRWDWNRRAADACRKVLQLKPTLHEARLELAEALMRTGDFKAAREELNKLLRTKAAGKASQMLARSETAKAAFMAPVLAQPKGVARDLALAERYAGYGAFDLAARIYCKLLKTSPRNPRVHYGQAMYLWHVKNDLDKAIEHADRALKLRPGDRDLLIELCPLYMQAGRCQQVVDLITKAPAGVRKLSHMQKHLAVAYWETGRLERSWKILTSVRLYNWEGEFAHVEAYADAALALAERALLKGDLAEARQMVDMAADPSKAPNLGVLRDRGNAARIAFWNGLLALRAGKPAEAQRIWHSVVDPLLAMNRLPVMINEWFLPPRPENEYMRVMCAVALGDAKATRHATHLLERLCREWVTGTGERRTAPVDLLAGLIAELKGEFAVAAKCFQKHLAKAAHKQLVAPHLKAVLAGQRRYEALLEAAQNGKASRKVAAGA